MAMSTQLSWYLTAYRAAVATIHQTMSVFGIACRTEGSKKRKDYPQCHSVLLDGRQVEG